MTLTSIQQTIYKPTRIHLNKLTLASYGNKILQSPSFRLSVLHGRWMGKYSYISQTAEGYRTWLPLTIHWPPFIHTHIQIATHISTHKYWCSDTHKNLHEKDERGKKYTLIGHSVKYAYVHLSVHSSTHPSIHPSIYLNLLYSSGLILTHNAQGIC